MELKLDCCPVTDAVLDRLKNVNKVHGDYSGIKTRGGNEKKILIFVNELYKLLNERGLLTSPTTYNEAHSQQLRKLTLFLIVNTDLSFKYNLKQDQNVAKCLGKCSQLTKCFLLHLIWGLNLHDFFYESVALTPHWMSLELLDAAKSNMEFLEPFDLIDKTQRLIEALYHQISRLQFVKMDDNERKMILSAFFRIFIHLLQLFIKPPSDKMSGWGKCKFMRYAGYCMRNALQMAICCINKFLKFPTRKLSKTLSLYDIKLQDAPYKYTTSITQDNKYHPDINNSLMLLNNNIFDTCTANIKSICLETFVYWAEIDVPSGDSLQVLISTLSYELLELIKTREEFKHELLDLLPTLAKKPKTLHEKIRDADSETVIKFCLIKNEDQKAWFDRLVDCDDLLTNDDSFECLKRNIVLMDGDKIKIVIDKAASVLKDSELEDERREEIKSLVLLALKSVRSTESQIRAVQGFFIAHGINNVFETNTFTEDLLQVFNRTIVMDNYKLQQMLRLVLQNPAKVYRKTIETCIKNSMQVDMMSEMLSNYAPIGYIRFKAMTYETKDGKAQNESLFMATLMSVFDEIEIGEQDIPNFVKFIQNVVRGRVVDAGKLSLQFLAPKMQSCSREEDYVRLLCLLRGFDTICTDKEVCSKHAPLLVIMAQILERTRWNLLSYRNIRALVVEATIDTINNIGAEFVKGKTAEDDAVIWLQRKFATLNPLDRAHFSDLWSEDLVWKKSLNYKLESECMSRSDNVAYLCEMICRMVSSEVPHLPQSTVSDPLVICDAISAISMVVEHHLGSDSALACLHHFCKIAAILLKNNALSSPNTTQSKNSYRILFEKLLTVLGHTPKSVREECCLTLIQVLSSLLQALITTTGDEEGLEMEIERLEKLVLALDGCPQTQGVLIKILCFTERPGDKAMDKGDDDNCEMKENGDEVCKDVDDENVVE